MAGHHQTESRDNTAGSPGFVSEAEAWSRLKGSFETGTFSSAWLEIQSRLIGSDVHYGLVLFGVPDQGPFEPVAVWPVNTAPTQLLIKTIESTITQQQSVVIRDENSADNSDTYVIASPILVDSQVCGAIAFEIEATTEQRLNEIRKLVEWGSGWLEVNVHRNRYTSTDRLSTVLNLIATGLHYEKFQAAATAVATELAGILGCERVSIGFLKGQHSQLSAMSHSATFGKKANIVRVIEAAMDEAIDQHATVTHPPVDPAAMQVTRMHEALTKQQGGGTACTVPLTEGERLLGAIVFERPDGELFDERTIRLCEHVASLLGPLLDIKRKDDRWLVAKAMDSGRAQLKKLLGPRHAGMKLATYGSLLLLVFFLFAEGNYRVTADARLEGTIQRAVSAPFAGYVVDANVRAGDVVKRGDILFSLDDRDLRLERLKWASQKLQSSREYSDALANHDRAKARIISAQIEQADAEIALLDEQLQRTRVGAPFDSFVVSGDLSQSLGAPVERGDVIFELAPLNAYRVILKVDERDIEDIKNLQTGELVLSSLPDEVMKIMVEKITPVSTTESGQNYFRVEARLEGDISKLLRPGMQGVGKIDIEQRKLFWIWTHRITHWLRMFFWSWWP